MFYWQEDPSKIQQGRKSGRWLKEEILAVNGPMVVCSTGASISKCMQTKKTFGHSGLEELPDSRERAGAPVLWLSKKSQTDVWEMFSDNSLPVDLTTKNSESFSPQLLQGFWS